MARGPCTFRKHDVIRAVEAARKAGIDIARAAKTAARGLAPLQSRTDSEVISPTAMAGGNTGLVLCQVGGQYSGQ